MITQSSKLTVVVGAELSETFSHFQKVLHSVNQSRSITIFQTKFVPVRQTPLNDRVPWRKHPLEWNRSNHYWVKKNFSRHKQAAAKSARVFLGWRIFQVQNWNIIAVVRFLVLTLGGWWAKGTRREAESSSPFFCFALWNTLLFASRWHPACSDRCDCMSWDHFGWCWWRLKIPEILFVYFAFNLSGAIGLLKRTWSRGLKSLIKAVCFVIQDKLRENDSKI